MGLTFLGSILGSGGGFSLHSRFALRIFIRLAPHGCRLYAPHNRVKRFLCVAPFVSDFMLEIEL
jgi:hypothetical protein